MTERFSGKVALVTGGTGGIGAGTVRRLAKEGAKVVFTGSNQDAADALSADTGAVFYKHRVQEADAWPGLMDMIKSSFGRLDIAFANAGIETGDGPTESVSMDAWETITSVNQTGVMLTFQYAINAMKENPDGPNGALVVNSSMNGKHALGNYAAYSTTKAAVIALAKATALHCAKQGYKIRCNAILPGVVETDMIKGVINSTPDPVAARAQFNAMAPLNRMAQVEEVAGLVAYLASDEAAFISGADIVIDGATTAGMMGV